MKNNKTIAALLISASLILSCKKKDTTPAPEPTPVTPATTAHINKLTANLNGQPWAMMSDENSSAYSMAKFNNTYYFGGKTNYSTPYTWIQFTLKDTVGTFNLTKYGNFIATYTSTNNIIFTSVNGTLNISTFDTTGSGSGMVKKLKGTFSFQTDTISSQSYTITTGVIDFEKQ